MKCSLCGGSGCAAGAIPCRPGNGCKRMLWRDVKDGKQNDSTHCVLTSGGDAPGMNAVIRAVVRTASAYNISVLGIRRGYSGLINGDIIEMAARSVDGIIRKGGTMLYTARCLEMLTEEGLQKAADTCKYLGIDGLICCGGDGTFRGAQALSRKEVPCIGRAGHD